MSKKTVLIIGGSGKVAKRLTTLLVATDPPHKVHSIIRSEKHVDDLKNLGATPHLHSIESTTVDSLASKIKDISPGAIVWAAGAGAGSPERTKAVDEEGAIKAMDAAAQAGIKRFVIVSALDLRDREGKPTPDWYTAEDKTTSDRVWGAIGAYMKAKFNADRELRMGNERRQLQYTIVRPTGLTEDEGTGRVAAGKVRIGKQISRSDVASVVLECLQNERTIGLAFDVAGGDTSINEAIDSVADGRVDCFEGYY